MTLELKDDPNLISEYIYWHENEHIWPEIPRGIKEAGIINMEIYRHENKLFMIIEAGPDFNFERDMARLAGLPRQQEWEVFVSRFQRSEPGSSSAEKWKMMNKIFSLG